MKKIFSFLCMLMAMTAMISCSSSKEEKGTTGTGNAAVSYTHLTLPTNSRV